MATFLPALKSSLDWLRDEIDTTFDRFMPKRRDGGDLVSSFFGADRPTIEMEDDENEIRVTAELPGLDKEDFKVELRGDRLLIHGEKKAEHEEKKGSAFYSERTYGSFSRTIALPSEVDPDKVEAVYKNGILSLRLPKTEAAKSKPIDVKIG